MTSNILRFVLAAICLPLFSGCASVLIGTDNCSQPSTSQRTTAPTAAISEHAIGTSNVKDDSRWGPLALLIGPYWVVEQEGYSTIYQYEWIDEGRAIKRTYEAPYAQMAETNNVTTFKIGPEPNTWTACINFGDFDRKTTYRLTADNTLLEDWISLGSNKFREEIRVTREKGYEQRSAVGLNGAPPTLYPFNTLIPYSAEEFAKLDSKFSAEKARFNAYAAGIRAEEKARKEAKSAEFWNNMATGLAALSQATAQASQEYAAQQAQRDALNQSIERSREIAAARERERIANDQAQLRLKQQRQAQDRAAQLQAAAQAQAAAGNRQAALQAQAAQREAEVKAQAAVRDAERQKKVAEQERQARLNAQQQMAQSATASQSSSHVTSSNGVRASSLPGSRSSERASNLIRATEAIMACTKPDSAGRFECDSPVDTNLRGGPGTLSQWETPEKMLASMSAACPAPRRLASTTHLVWGCGFGATNNSNSMDRSAGVDVKGRGTYYCYEKQTSCRRTEP